MCTLSIGSAEWTDDSCVRIIAPYADALDFMSTWFAGARRMHNIVTQVTQIKL